MRTSQRMLAARYVVALAGVLAVLFTVPARDLLYAFLALLLADVVLWGVPRALARLARR